MVYSSCPRSLLLLTRFDIECIHLYYLYYLFIFIFVSSVYFIFISSKYVLPTSVLCQLTKDHLMSYVTTSNDAVLWQYNSSTIYLIHSTDLQANERMKGPINHSCYIFTLKHSTGATSSTRVRPPVQLIGSAQC